MSVSLSQIFSSGYDDIIDALGYIPKSTKQLIEIYMENTEKGIYPTLDDESMETVSNKHFFSSLTVENQTLDNVLNEMDNNSHRRGLYSPKRKETNFVAIKSPY